jgi:hypothetical protein
MAFDLVRLLDDVFAPEPGERVIVAVDVPRPGVADRPEWQDRRAWAGEWKQAFESLGARRGFATMELLTYPATGANNAELPARAEHGGRTVPLVGTLLESTLAVFLTEFSATAPLDGVCHQKEDFRAASMPGIARRMQDSALAADYREVARRCQALEEALRGASALEVTFQTGHHCDFDLRFRRAEADDGSLPRHKPGDRVINLPSGETFIVPYEGEQAGIGSETAGVIPIRENDELVLFHVAANRIARVEGVGTAAQRFRQFFAVDATRTNIAEVAFGCNDRAVVTGNVLEDEKAGFHWAFGRSDHLGGTVGVANFASPATVVHQDIVYAKGNPIQVAEAVVVRPGGRTRVIANGSYLIF